MYSFPIGWAKISFTIIVISAIEVVDGEEQEGEKGGVNRTCI